MSSKTVILDSPDQWDTWLFVVKTMADRGAVWGYIDPDLADEPTLPERPTKPAVTTIRNGATIVTLSAEERMTYQLLLSDYKEDLAAAKQVLDTLQSVRTLIITTVSTNNIVYIKDKTTVYQMLVALKKRLAPTDFARKLEITRKYNQLKVYSKKETVEDWLRSWELVYAEGKRLKIPEVEEERSLFDFTFAVVTVDSTYASTQEFFLNYKMKSKEKLPSLYDLVEDFRNHSRQTQERSKLDSSHSAFGTTTLRGRDQEGETKEREYTCLCDKQHRFEDCEYITPSTRPKGWKGKTEVFEKINKKILARKFKGRTGQREFFEKKYKYDGFNKVDSNPTLSNPTTPSNPTQPEPQLGAFTTHSTFHTNTQSDYKLYDSWTLDNASDIHVCNNINRSSFQKTRDAQPTEQVTAGKHTYQIAAWGTVQLRVDTPTGKGQMQLLNVALIPEFMTNLVALELLRRKGVHWSSREPDRLETDGRVFCYLHSADSHWILQNTSQQQPYTAMSAKKSQQPRQATFTGAQLHRVLGHASPEVISHVPQAVADVKIDNSQPNSPSTIDCQTCSLAKATEIVSRRSEVEYPESDTPFDRTSWDLIMLESGYNDDRYVSHFQCRKTLFNLVYTISRKTEIMTTLRNANQFIETQFGGKIRFLRLDRETTLGSDFDQYITSKGIRPERTAPDTPAANGGAERSGRVIITKTRAIRIEANLPADMWPECSKAAGYISNRTPVKKLGWKTPFEALTGNQPRIAHMHIYGCRAYPLDHHILRSQKVEPKAHIGYLVGYDSTNVYRIWIPSRQRVIRTRDVTFKDDLLYSPKDLDIGSILRAETSRIIESLELEDDRFYIQEPEPEDSDTLDTIVVEVPNQPGTPKSNPITAQLVTPSPTPSISSTPPESPPHQTLSLPTTQGNTAQRGNEISAELDEGNILSTTRTRGGGRKSAYAAALEDTDQLSGFHSAFSTSKLTTKPPYRDTLPNPPKSWKQMLNHIHTKQFKAAADKEFTKLFQKGTFEYRKRTGDERTIPLMWVFTYKFDSDGYLSKHKGRLVARGDLQATDEDTYAATLAAQLFRAIMAIATAFGLEIRQYDAVNAFVNARLATPIPCECAEGYEKEGMILWVLRALYRLKTSPLLWYKELTGTLESLGLHGIPGVNCLFVNDWLILLFHVDDILTFYSARDQSKMDEFESKLLLKYELRILGEAEHFLGIRIVRDRSVRKTWLLQEGYISKLAEKFNITVTKAPKTPLPTTQLQPYDGTTTTQQIFAYQQRVGSLNYAAIITRPDIAKSVSKLAEFLQNPSPAHIAAADQVLAYLIGTQYYAIQFDGKTTHNQIFLTHSDSAFADDPETRYSSYGFCFSLFGGVIHYKATKGKTVTTSSTEAELLALSATAKDFVWWLRFFKHLQFDLDEHPMIYCDNRQTIRLLAKETSKLQTALKHVDIHQSWLRQEVQAGRIDVQWIPTAEMVADGFTKVLPAQKHIEFVKQLNLVDIRDRFADLIQNRVQD